MPRVQGSSFHPPTAASALPPASPPLRHASRSTTPPRGRFDHADRLFHSIATTFHSCTHSSSDVKELIPELYYLPDALINGNDLPLGTRQVAPPPPPPLTF